MSGIDTEVLDVMKDEEILKSISDDKQVKRLILNCFCEFLSVTTQIRKEIDDLNTILSVCSAQKVGDYLKNLQKNMEKKVQNDKLQEKISMSHKKKQK